MKTLKAILLTVLALAIPTGFAAEAKGAKASRKATAEEEEPSVEDKMLPRWVIILGAYKTFAEAKADAEKFARASKVPFTMNGMIFDKKGLRYPDNFDDPVWAGEYLARRGNFGWSKNGELTEHLSVERSEGYEGFAKNLYIVVGAISETKADGLAQEKRFKAFAPDTYVKKTRIYMGCLH
jgi:hypothetical protein